jgi:hypothetical protein
MISWWRSFTIAAATLVCVGGALMLWDVERPQWQVGLNLLVLGILALVIAAVRAVVTAVWRVRNGNESNPGTSRSALLARPRRLVIVARDRIELYQTLAQQFATDVSVKVIVDRRHEHTLVPAAVQQRRDERRNRAIEVQLRSMGYAAVELEAC